MAAGSLRRLFFVWRTVACSQPEAGKDNAGPLKGGPIGGACGIARMRSAAAVKWRLEREWLRAVSPATIHAFLEGAPRALSTGDGELR
jgi:hypothetical protein